jgi:hypothetical protein
LSVLYLFIYVPLPAVPPVVAATGAAINPDTAGPGGDPIAPATNEQTVETMLLLSDAVPLSPDATNVSTQHRYLRYEILFVNEYEIMVR